jgi:hypothetical protein
MTHSGAGAKAGIDLTSAFNTGAAQAAEQQNINLASIARKRLEGEQAYNSQSILLQTPQPAV